MTRLPCRAFAGIVVLATLMLPSVRAQEHPIRARSLGAQPVSQMHQEPQPMSPQAAAPEVAVGSQPGYVQLGAPLYPSPQPHVPIWTGATFVPTPALAPHEMLYPHTYRAMYPPFYHRVVGKYYWTPFGMRTHEKWELQGTMVEVKYRSSHPKLKPFHAPRISTNGGPWY